MEGLICSLYYKSPWKRNAISNPIELLLIANGESDFEGEKERGSEKEDTLTSASNFNGEVQVEPTTSIGLLPNSYKEKGLAFRMDRATRSRQPSDGCRIEKWRISASNAIHHRPAFAWTRRTRPSPLPDRMSASGASVFATRTCPPAPNLLFSHSRPQSPQRLTPTAGNDNLAAPPLIRYLRPIVRGLAGFTSLKAE